MSIRNEQGQAMALSVICLTVLLALSALVLDVGSWYQEQRETQAAADAAALAGAQALPEDASEASALASSYVAKNGGGGTSVSFPTGNTVSVEVEREAPGFFARIFGVESVTVDGRASARTGVMTHARYAAPIAVDEKHPLISGSGCPCFGQATNLDLEKVGPGAFRLLNLDDSHGGTGPQTVADWILNGYDGYMPLNWYFSDPGAKFNSSHIKSAMTARIGDEMLFPIYRETRGEGANFEYFVVGWIGFVVSAFDAKGNGGTVDGHFTRVIWEGIQSESGTEADFGARAVELIE
jgi:hypothetical protein